LERTEVEVKLSEHTTVVITKLNAKEMMAADDRAGINAPEQKVAKAYSVCAVRKINGEVVQPWRNQLEFDSLCERLDAVELLILGVSVNNLSGVTDEQKKILEAAMQPPES
jgi:hypothetical protein